MIAFLTSGYRTDLSEATNGSFFTHRLGNMVVLKDIHQQQLEKYRADPAAAEKWRKVGQSPSDKKLDAAEHAAMAAVARVIMNLDEFVNKP